jgi:PPR repeat
VIAAVAAGAGAAVRAAGASAVGAERDFRDDMILKVMSLVHVLTYSTLMASMCKNGEIEKAMNLE